MRLPQSLQDTDDHSALAALKRYFGEDPAQQPSSFTGARFDTWDSTGTRHQDANRFTADDLVAVTFLSVDVPATAAIMLLGLLHDRVTVGVRQPEGLPGS